MKRFAAVLLLILTAVALLAVTASAATTTTALSVRTGPGQFETVTVNTASLEVDGQLLQTDVPAFVYRSRTMVPIRFISDALGANVEWNQDALQATITTADKTIVLTIGSATALVNGQSVALYDGVPATMAVLNGISRTVVPVRFVSEQLGASVEWDQQQYLVSITSPQKPETPQEPETPAVPETPEEPDVPTEPETPVEPETPAVEPDYTVSVPQKSSGGVLSWAASDTGVSPRVFTLDGRVVFDYPGGKLDKAGGTVAVNGPVVKTIRYNQYDHGYDDTPYVARIVLDLQTGMTKEDLEISTTGGSVSIRQVGDPRPLVVVDAGHGGKDPGAMYDGYNEKDFVLPMALEVGQRLEAAGCRVIYSRDDDTYITLSDRADLANELGADIFISIHANAMPQKPDINGLETYCYKLGGQAEVLANYVHDAILEAASPEDRGVRTANYYVLRETDMPAILVETGYMSNADECQMLADATYQKTLARGIANGAIDYLQAAGLL